MKRSEQAAAFHANGCNCAQAVACAFADKTGIDTDTTKALTKRYGGGAYGTCGAVMGAYAVLNFLNGHVKDDPAAPAADTSDMQQKVAQAFTAKNQTVLCSELKGKTTGKVLRSCRGCVEDAADILENLVNDISIPQN